MQNFSVETAGFVALTLTELMLQECVKKGILSKQEVKHLLNAAAQRHEDAAGGDQEKIDLNTEAAHMIRALMQGLAPLFNEEEAELSKIKNKPVEKAKASNGAVKKGLNVIIGGAS